MNDIAAITVIIIILVLAIIACCVIKEFTSVGKKLKVERILKVIGTVCCIGIIAALITVVTITDRNMKEQNKDKMIVTVTPTVQTEQITSYDEIYIYGYKPDGTLYEGSGEKKYDVYSTGSFNNTCIKVRCTVEDANNLLEMARECNIEIKKAE